MGVWDFVTAGFVVMEGRLREKSETPNVRVYCAPICGLLETNILERERKKKIEMHRILFQNSDIFFESAHKTNQLMLLKVTA